MCVCVCVCVIEKENKEEKEKERKRKRRNNVISIAQYLQIGKYLCNAACPSLLHTSVVSCHALLQREREGEGEEMRREGDINTCEKEWETCRLKRERERNQ